MRGCKIKVSLSALLKTIGLTNSSDIGLFTVTTAGCEHTDSFWLILCSEYDENLPEVLIGQEFPEADIECERIQSRITMIEKEEVMNKPSKERRSAGAFRRRTDENAYNQPSNSDIMSKLDSISREIGGLRDLVLRHNIPGYGGW